MADKVIKEFEQIGKYKVRVIIGMNGVPQLDIREHVETDKFCNFTRRGIRVNLIKFKALLEDSPKIVKIMEKPIKTETKLHKTTDKQRG